MKNLGDLEAVVMDILWASPEPVTVREVLETLEPTRPLAYTTVMTVMDNLHRKGFLLRELDGRAYRYRPAKPREDHAAELMAELLAESGNRSNTLLRFVDYMSREELSNLKKALEQRKRDGRP